MSEPAKDNDKSAKWLIERHGDSILRLGGVTDLVRWQGEMSPVWAAPRTLGFRGFAWLC